MRTARRRFLGSLVAIPLAPSALAQPPSPAPPVAPSPSAPPPSPVAEAMAEVARRRFGGYFESGDAEAVLRLLGDNLKAAERLQATKLGNADEPVTVFSARPRASAGRGGGRR